MIGSLSDADSLVIPFHVDGHILLVGTALLLA